RMRDSEYATFEPSGLITGESWSCCAAVTADSFPLPASSSQGELRPVRLDRNKSFAPSVERDGAVSILEFRVQRFKPPVTLPSFAATGIPQISVLKIWRPNATMPFWSAEGNTSKLVPVVILTGAAETIPPAIPARQTLDVWLAATEK